jgi:hypothetical protein
MDERSLQLSVRLFHGDPGAWYAGNLESSLTLDLGANYPVAEAGRPLSLTRNAARPPAPYAALLLFDQSANVIESDPWDARLYAARYFLGTASPANHVALGAFAADDPTTGEQSLLPQQPVTLYPTNTPTFKTAGAELFPYVDALADAEGGTAPLYAAIDAALDFAAASAPAGPRRALIVLTDGRDRTCTSDEQCDALRQAVIEKSRANAIEIITVADMQQNPDLAALHELTHGSEGMAFWYQDASQLGVVYATVGSYLDGSVGTYQASFHVESGAGSEFQPGQVLHGDLRYTICPWDCYDAAVPAAVPIP